MLPFGLSWLKNKDDHQTLPIYVWKQNIVFIFFGRLTLPLSRTLKCRGMPGLMGVFMAEYFLLTQSRSSIISDGKGGPCLLGASWHEIKEVVFLEMEWGESGASEEDALSTPLHPT